MKKTPDPSHLRTHRKCGRSWLSFFCVLLLVPAALVAEDRQITSNRIRKEATIFFSGQYQIASASSLVEQALDYPFLMGSPWSLYGYAPAYKLSELDEPNAFHVDDSTGIAGNIRLVSTAGRSRVYLAEGTLNHWAVPILNAGSAVFEVEIRSGQAATLMGIDVFLKPESRIAGTILWALSPIIKARIENRISLNLQDVAHILTDIAGDPAKVADQLREEFQQRFFLAFGK